MNWNEDRDYYYRTASYAEADTFRIEHAIQGHMQGFVLIVCLRMRGHACAEKQLCG